WPTASYLFRYATFRPISGVIASTRHNDVECYINVSNSVAHVVRSN
uniref:Saposin A-type domain-containing protein n=1 Tax=Parascaris univalens TaxID=6257 RepID=A0A915AMS1_PARUN